MAETNTIFKAIILKLKQEKKTGHIVLWRLLPSEMAHVPFYGMCFSQGHSYLLRGITFCLWNVYLSE